MNSFYKVEKPLRIFRHLGHSDSNTYVGSSRAIKTVMEAVNAKPGDELHLLGGGFFVKSEDGVLRPFSKEAPKHIFEKSYGFRQTPKEWGDDLVKQGIVSPMPAPTTKVDYNAGRMAVETNRLPPLQAAIRHVEESPELTSVKAIVAKVMERLDGESFEVHYNDTDAYETASATFATEAGAVKVVASPFRTFVRVGDVGENFREGDREQRAVDCCVWLLVPENAPTGP